MPPTTGSKPPVVQTCWCFHDILGPFAMIGICLHPFVTECKAFLGAHQITYVMLLPYRLIIHPPRQQGPAHLARRGGDTSKDNEKLRGGSRTPPTRYDYLLGGVPRPPRRDNYSLGGGPEMPRGSPDAGEMRLEKARFPLIEIKVPGQGFPTPQPPGDTTIF